ncbi:hypothetical protein BUALT_Bualt06G0070000 [Buddleja alternifolia]|uniref:Uncharacterized protein n=1 Tax=Buddleja alternifolia TaxID=168488 RepID=A0AAV6XK29_9LAMI|nr:hypothetical protein BUALT_Bualt06G0070000 [Buddleja alternifolia]
MEQQQGSEMTASSSHEESEVMIMPELGLTATKSIVSICENLTPLVKILLVSTQVLVLDRTHLQLWLLSNATSSWLLHDAYSDSCYLAPGQHPSVHTQLPDQLLLPVNTILLVSAILKTSRLLTTSYDMWNFYLVSLRHSIIICIGFCNIIIPLVNFDDHLARTNALADISKVMNLVAAQHHNIALLHFDAPSAL